MFFWFKLNSLISTGIKQSKQYCNIITGFICRWILSFFTFFSLHLPCMLNWEETPLTSNASGCILFFIYIYIFLLVWNFMWIVLRIWIKKQNKLLIYLLKCFCLLKCLFCVLAVISIIHQEGLSGNTVGASLLISLEFPKGSSSCRKEHGCCNFAIWIIYLWVKFNMVFSQMCKLAMTLSAGMPVQSRCFWLQRTLNLNDVLKCSLYGGTFLL